MPERSAVPLRASAGRAAARRGTVRIWRTAAGVVLTLWLTSAACTASSSPSSADQETAGNSSLDADRAFCVERMNLLRASKQLPPFSRNATLERYADEAARTDGLAHRAHRHARETNHGGLTAHAENEILWWSLEDYGSVRTIIDGGLADMWKQGAGGTHYENLVGPYTQAGCGIFVNGDEVTVVTAFR